MLADILKSNVLFISSTGKVLGIGSNPNINQIEEYLNVPIKKYIDGDLNERLLEVLSTKEKPKSIVESFKEGWQQGVKEVQNKPSKKESLSTWEKIALGIAGFFALTGICGGTANGMWIAVIISLCAMGAICAVFMGIIEKKYAWTTAIASFLIVCITIGASSSNEGTRTSVDNSGQEVQAEVDSSIIDNIETNSYPEEKETSNLDWLQGHWVYQQAGYEAHLVIMENTVRQYSSLNPEPTYYTFKVDGDQLWVKPIKNDGTDFVATLDLQNHRIDYGNGNWMYKIGR